ncbi:protein transport protein Sec24AB isoform X2 [Lycorma delicatula]
MNGQLFNSSGSGHGTPTPPSNSSYPASLSSQSSRDPSPQSRGLGGMHSQYGYTDHDQKSSSHILYNNVTNMTTDPSKQQQPQQQQQPGLYSPRSQQLMNNTAVKSQALINHNSPSISSYNSTSMSSYVTSGMKYNVTLQNSTYNSSQVFSDMQNNIPHHLTNKNQFPSNSPFNATLKQSDVEPDTSVNSIVDPVSSHFQLPSNSMANVSQSVPNIPPSTLSNINLMNSSTSSDQSKPHQTIVSHGINSTSKFHSGSTDVLANLPVSSPPPPQPINSPVSSPPPQSSSPRLVNPTISSPRSHSLERSSSSNVNNPSLSQYTAVSQNAPQAPFQSSVQNIPPSNNKTHTVRQSGISTTVSSLANITSNQQVSQSQPPVTSSIASASPLHNKDQARSEEIGSGDQCGKQSSLDQVKSPLQQQQQQTVAHSQLQSLQNQASVRSNPYPSSTQVFGQYSNARQAVSSSNFNPSQSLNVQQNMTSSLSTPQSQSQSQLFNSNQHYPSSSMPNVSTGQNKPPVPSYSSSNQAIIPPTSVVKHPTPPVMGTGQQQPQLQQHVPATGSGPIQQMPPTNLSSYQKMPPASIGSYQQKPPVGLGSHSQMPPTTFAQNQQGPLMPPTGFRQNQQIPSTSFGLSQQIPPTGLGPHQSLQTSPKQYQSAPPVGEMRKGPPMTSYQQSQFQQRPPLPNQYPQYASQNAPIQSQPHNTGGPYQGLSRYPNMPHGHGGAVMDTLTNQLRGTSVTQDGFNKLWGMDTYDLLKTRELLPKDRIEAPHVRLNPELFDAANCSPELFRCTLTKIPETKSLLDKSRLPLGVLIHPFKDLSDVPTVDDKADEQLSVIQCSTIVRCRACRTYINPFVYFVDNKRWKCNLCFRVNELPDEFQFDPISKTYGDPSRRPEIKSATIEFIAPSEYMVRPPQPAIYLFLFDVSRLGAETGYLDVVCQTLLEELSQLPGDARTSVGFITYDSSVHFYSLAEGLSQPHQMVVVDIEDMFLPCPENLLVNLSECHDLIKDLLVQLPKQYAESYNTESALGAALQAAYKLLAPTGGRVTVFQSRLPSVGPGALTPREDPSQRASDSVPHLNPITDFYKKLALDCSSQQIAVDLFIVNSQYVDIATLSGISRFSGGCMYHFPLFRSVNNVQVNSLKRTFERYLTRKIGFESVMRLRCTRGLSIHTFHGNFFVRSTDLLSLPNVNPDAGFGMQVSIDESLSELQNVCFQAALLYTSSKGERRIRVHTLCLPIATNLSDILNGADQQCIIGLLSKMAVDRSIESSLADAREAFVNVVADILSAYKLTQSSGSSGCLLAPKSLRLVPLYILALLKNVAFRTGQCTRLDDRVFAMCQMKTLPLALLLQSIYPDLYPVHDLSSLQNLDQQPSGDNGDDSKLIVLPPRLHLSSEKLDSQGIFLLDTGTMILILVGHNVNPGLCQALFGVPAFTALPQDMYELPELNTPESERLRDFVFMLQTEKPVDPSIQIIRDDSSHVRKFLEYLIEDKNEAGTSYYEFLQRIKVLMK